MNSLDAMNIHPDYASDQPNMSGNSRSIFGGGSADKVYIYSTNIQFLDSVIYSLVS